MVFPCALGLPLSNFIFSLYSKLNYAFKKDCLRNPRHLYTKFSIALTGTADAAEEVIPAGLQHSLVPFLLMAAVYFNFELLSSVFVQR
jgi:hypothetical protein